MKKLLQIVIAVFTLSSIVGCQSQTTSNMQGIEGQMEVHFVDVGQGQAQIIISPSNQVMVIDGGNNDDEDRMVSYLQSLGVEQIDVLIGTHPDADHIGGIDAVIDTFDIANFYMPPIAVTTKTFQSVLASAKEKNLTVQPIQKGTDLPFDSSCTVDVLSPAQKSKDSNEMSVVVKLACGKSSFLFSGDVEGEAEELLVHGGNDIDIDVILVPHHGSDGSTSTEFLDETTPEICVIQVGKENSYGHPGSETLKRLKASGTQVYRTDELGNIVVMAKTDTGKYTVNQKSVAVDSNKNTASARKSSQLFATATVKIPNPTQNATEEIVVKVVDQNQKAVPNAKITLTLQFASKETIYTEQTNQRGEALFSFQIGRAKVGYTVEGELLITKSGQTLTEKIAFTPK